MDLRYSDDDEAFREKLAAWLAREVPAHGAAPAANDWRARREFQARSAPWFSGPGARSGAWAT